MTKHVGPKDSVVPNGDQIREDRLKQDLSQDALSATSGRRFSVETLRRAEKSKVVSKEKLRYIADALRFKLQRYLPSDERCAATSPDCPSCWKGHLVVLIAFTSASDGTFVHHRVTRKCSVCGQISEQ